MRSAFELFCERGVEGTRTVDVARAARVSHGTVFVHCPTRDTLVEQVITKYGGEMAMEIRALAEQGGTVREVLAAHLEGLSRHEAFYARLVQEGPTLPPNARHTLLGLQSAISHHLSAAAEREIAAGTMRRQPMHLVFNGWLGLVHHYLVNRDLFAPGESVCRARGQELLDFYLGLLAP